MWASVPLVQERHELRTDGPYGLVRHPIYTGFLGLIPRDAGVRLRYLDCLSGGCRPVAVAPGAGRGRSDGWEVRRFVRCLRRLRPGADPVDASRPGRSPPRQRGVSVVRGGHARRGGGEPGGTRIPGPLRSPRGAPPSPGRRARIHLRTCPSVIAVPAPAPPPAARAAPPCGPCR
ncbi:hypothetical protein [Streptomyces sp. 2224.1]|uniref:hypothetical protein n=1 Tax=Streptomyces sp. 2224.1 TaxID=1881020 RepID=UPI00210DDEC5|nr:hypothetical protein [Streptomyces sp. 2224.1]